MLVSPEVHPSTTLAPIEVGELYRGLSTRLERIVRNGIHAPDSVIEDACQFAWGSLVHHRSRVRRDAAFSWLVTTAFHEAFRLAGRDRRDLSLEAELDDHGEFGAADLRPGPVETCEHHERLESVGQLPPRQQRLLWLRGLGLSYDEIAVQDRCTARTVERQIKRARDNLKTAVAE